MTVSDLGEIPSALKRKIRLRAKRSGVEGMGDGN
jgi:hypothetical protein